jgi:hypothetical protein
MATQTSYNSIEGSPHRQRVFFIIAGMCALIVVLAVISAFSPAFPDLSPVITYLSEVRVTPVWPQIGLVSTLAR